MQSFHTELSVYHILVLDSRAAQYSGSLSFDHSTDSDSYLELQPMKKG